MSAASSLPAPALQASRAAVQSALRAHGISEGVDGKSEVADPNSADKANGETEEPGEIQEIEVDMQAQAEQIRTVFNDPTNFNVKVCTLQSRSSKSLTSVAAPALLDLDALVRLARDQRSQPAADAIHSISADASPANTWRGSRVDGGYQACHPVRQR